MNNTLDICKKTREIAAETFSIALGGLLQTKKLFSEVMLRDRWLEELRKHKELFPDGWYIPPAHGIGVLFGTAKKDSRVKYTNLRDPKYLPRDDIFFSDENEMAYVYASPVDKQSGTIGDFGMVLYRGVDPIVQKHLKRCLEIDKEIFEQVSVSMTFSEIYQVATEIFEKYKLSNNIISTTDNAVVNIGHTIPSFAEFTAAEKGVLQHSDWTAIKDILSKKRKFINALEKTTVQPGMAITMEPRLTVVDNPTIPMASYHTIITLSENGEKEFLTNFDKIFRLMGMEYMKD